MIHRINNEYAIDGTPCVRLIEEAVKRGWAKRARVVVLPVPASVPVPIPTPKSVQPITLEERAKAAGMSVDELLDMRMRNKERMEGK